MADGHENRSTPEGRPAVPHRDGPLGSSGAAPDELGLRPAIPAPRRPAETVAPVKSGASAEKTGKAGVPPANGNPSSTQSNHEDAAVDKAASATPTDASVSAAPADKAALVTPMPKATASGASETASKTGPPSGETASKTGPAGGETASREPKAPDAGAGAGGSKAGTAGRPEGTGWLTPGAGGPAGAANIFEEALRAEPVEQAGEAEPVPLWDPFADRYTTKKYGAGRSAVERLADEKAARERADELATKANRASRKKSLAVKPAAESDSKNAAEAGQAAPVAAAAIAAPVTEPGAAKTGSDAGTDAKTAEPGAVPDAEAHDTRTPNTENTDVKASTDTTAPGSTATVEKPANQKAPDEKPASNQALNEKAADEKTADEKATDKKDADEKTADDKATGEKATGDKVAAAETVVAASGGVGGPGSGNATSVKATVPAPERGRAARVLRRANPVRAVVVAGRGTSAWAKRPAGRLILPVIIAVLLVGGAGTAGAYLVPKALKADAAPSATPGFALDGGGAGGPSAAPPSAGISSAPTVPPLGATTAPAVTGAGRPADALAGWAQQVGTRVGIPVVAVEAYSYAELVLVKQMPSCHLSWTTLAAIGFVESDHGSYHGAVLGADGSVQPPIYGLPLDGKGGRQLIKDTDQGTLDGDSTYDRAVGPMQFIPSTWRQYGKDADNNGVADPNDLDDAALTAGVYLCQGGRDLANIDSWWDAILSYNAIGSYAQKVFDTANLYGQRSRV